VTSEERERYLGLCRKCVIQEIKTHVEKLEKEPIETKPRKPSNVIYVVNKPRPGQVRGDWAVRGHGKIYSYHRTKNMAVKKARIIAQKRGATVLVQKTDGTFSTSYKPKSKNR
jgi:hypothetical protein